MGCRTAGRFTTFNLSDPGWLVRQGQAIWRSEHHGPEIAGELLVATHPDQRFLVEFNKTPLPILIAQATAREWRIQFTASQRAISGRGSPPPTLAWLHLPRCLNGIIPPAPLRFERRDDGSWRLENTRSGEIISGFLNP